MTNIPSQQLRYILIFFSTVNKFESSFVLIRNVTLLTTYKREKKEMFGRSRYLYVIKTYDMFIYFSALKTEAIIERDVTTECKL